MRESVFVTKWPRRSLWFGAMTMYRVWSFFYHY